MQLGKSLVGALIGSAVGVGLTLATYYFFALDHTGLAILVAVCAGLGVRAVVNTKAHASYLRGGLTCIVAIVAFAACKFLIADLAVRGAFAKPMKPVVARPAEDASDREAAAEGPTQPIEAPQPDRPQQTGGAVGAMHAPPSFSTWDFVLLSIAALVAYELGRGTGAHAAAVAVADA
jgi:hypothetical protein